MKRNTKIALVMMALSAMAMGSTSAFAHGGHGMWQQNAAPLTSEQQTAWQKIHNDFYAQSSALQQQLVTKRYEYNALLARGRKSIMTFTLKAAHCNSNW